MTFTADKFSLEQYAERVVKLAQSCPTMNPHNFLELLAIWKGCKSVIRLVVTDDTYKPVQEFCEDLALVQMHSIKRQAPKVSTSTGDTFTVSVEWDDPTGKFFVVIIGRTAEAVQKAIECEDAEVSFREFGSLYGYPPCCIETYAEIQGGEDWIASYLRRSPLHLPGRAAGNRLAVLFDGSTLIPDYFPCTIGCAPTAKLGEQYSALLRDAGWSAYLYKIQESLMSPILIRSGTLLQLFGCRRSGNVFYYTASRDWQINWRGSLSLDDPFFDSDTMTILGDTMRFAAGGKVLAQEPMGVLDNRLLIFQ